MLEILCSEGVYLGGKIFSSLGRIELYKDGTLESGMLRGKDVLITRSSDLIDAGLLKNSDISFVGSAVTGSDHLDKAGIEGLGIRCYNASGCNSESVAEYVIAALLRVSQDQGFSLAGRTLGIIGFGNIGKKLAFKSQALGLEIILNDPFEESRQHEKEKFSELGDLIERSDIISIHVPLTYSGPHPTFHLADRGFFAAVKKGCFFLNTSRGAVVDTGELLKAIELETIKYTVIDTWENEPDIDAELLDQATIATAHIAGHSVEGKLWGSLMVYKELCRFIHGKSVWDFKSLTQDLKRPHIKTCYCGQLEKSLDVVVRSIYDIAWESSGLKIHKDCTTAEYFKKIRKNYPVRREFASARIDITDTDDTEEFEIALQKLGFLL